MPQAESCVGIGTREQSSLASASTYSHHPSHQLLHPHVQRISQSDERAQARVHRGAGAGFALLELLVGVRGDAGGMGKGFLAEALAMRARCSRSPRLVQAKSSNCNGDSQALSIVRRMPARVKETARRAALVLRSRWSNDAD